ncbi:hypothetical protein [Acinetobacter baumannii]|uniref:hypothetical protein n=1 Tax=Acinetobacter baumannii TaxID=470 RepID=UPI0025A096BF|nr:hypothetical protein [Acinetobacter baumannii]
MFEDLIKKCEEKNIKFEQKSTSLLINILRGREEQEIRISHTLLQHLQDNNFLDYRLVPNYDAVWSEKHKVIECEVDSSSSRKSLFERYFSEFCEEEDKLSFKINNYTVEITSPSNEFIVLNDFQAQDMFAGIGDPAKKIENRKRYTTVIRIIGKSVESSNEAKKIIETIVESLCFELSCRFDILFTPSVPRKRSRKIPKQTKITHPIKINKKIDNNALSYYWNAEAARGLPLVSFLGYYQVVEYFYSFFSEKDLQTKISNIIKDPAFNVHNHKDILKIISANKNFITNSNDKTKLEITIHSSLIESDFKEWFISDEERVKYFKGNSCEKVSSKKINSTSESELLKQALARIYDVRCRIVHTDTNSSSNSSLSPRQHIENFEYELELAKFFAQKVLIATSTDF